MSFAPKQFIRSVDFLSTENATNTSTGSVNIYGGMSVSKDSYLTNMIVVGNSTIANLTISGNLRISTGNTLTSSQWTSIDSNTDIYFGTSANAFVGIGTTTPNFNLDISGGSRITGGLTVGNLNVNTGATITNLLNTTICTGTIIATNGITTGTINATGTSTFQNVTTSNLKVSGTINSGDITVGNINFTGSLFQNGTGYLGSQWTTTSGNTLTYTSGNISVNSGFASSFNSNTLGNIFTTGGNVGIGTTSPSAGLHSYLSAGNDSYASSIIAQVNGTGWTNPLKVGYDPSQFYTSGGIYFYLSPSDWNNNRIGLGLAGGSSMLKLSMTSMEFNGPFTVNSISTDTVSSTLLSATGNSNTLGNIFTTGGNVGIGTNSPANTLDVSGSARITTSLTTGSLFSTNLTTSNIVGTNMTVTNMNSSTNTIGTLNATGVTTASLLSTNSVLTNVSVTNMNSTTNTIGTLNATGVTTASLLATSASIGNISAGTINLSNNMNIAGTLTVVNVTTTNLTMSNGNALLNLVTSGSILNTGIISTVNLISTNITVNSVVVTGGSLNATFNSNTVGALVTTGGNVGIGSATPIYKLDVNGSARITNTSATSMGTLIIAGPGSTTYLPATTTSGQLASFYGPGGPGVISNIDFSTYLPTSAAMSLPSVRFSMKDLGAANSDFNILTKNSGSTGTMASRIFIDGSGNVGINTTNPTYTLDINGTSRVNGTLLATNNSNTLGNLYTTGGNVGIGTISPSVTLDVIGGIRSNGISSITQQGAHLQWNRSGNDGETWLINQKGASTSDTIRLGSSTTNNIVTEWWRFHSNNLYNMIGGNTYIDGNTSTTQWIFGYNTPKHTSSISPIQVYTNSTDRVLALQVTSKGTISGIDSVQISVPLISQHNSNTIGNIFTTGGNVGIGISTPSEKLHIAGNLRIGNSTQSNYIMFSGTNGDQTGHTYIGERVYENPENSELLLFKGNDLGASGTDRIRLLSAEHRFDTYTNILDGTFDVVGTTGSSNRMIILNNGNIGINTTSPNYTLQVAGDIYASGDVISFSDSRLKSDVVTIDNALDKVSSMRGVYYTNINTQERDTGVIAQEIAEILPEVVADKGEYLGVAYGNIVGVLIEAIKELKARVEQLENR
jgi:hypothetical protein